MSKQGLCQEMIFFPFIKLVLQCRSFDLMFLELSFLLFYQRSENNQ